MCLAIVQRRSTDSAQCVFSGCDGFHMSGVNTSAIPTKVVDYQPVRDWTYQKSVGESMGLSLFPIYIEPAISCSTKVARPEPAARCFLDPIPEADFGGEAAIIAESKRGASVSPAAIMLLAPTAPMLGLVTVWDDTL